MSAARKLKWPLLGGLVVVLVGGMARLVVSRAGETGADTGGERSGVEGPVPVELAPVEQGSIERRRTFTGTLEAGAEFVVAPKIGGHLEQVAVELGDVVERGQVVAELDDDELRQAANQAQAELAVARAEEKAADNRLDIAKRTLERVQTLRERGVASEEELDRARADKLEAEAQAEVAASAVQSARAAYRASAVRAGYAKVTADWSGGDDERVVAARYADEGQMVQANAQLLSIVDLDPVNVVVYATEEDYAQLDPGQSVTVETDAYPGETFRGEVGRIAPVFRTESRQARVELIVDNPDHRLKPGMFVRAVTVLERVEDATIVPEEALVDREGRTSVFVVDEDGTAVSLRPVETGIRQGGRVQVKGKGIHGRVVTLGQQRLRDGSAITVPSGSGSERVGS